MVTGKNGGNIGDEVFVMSIDEHADHYVIRLARLNNFYHDIFNQNINMDGFEDRLKLQKLIYILNFENIRFPYGFTWYIHGPYSSKLTRDGYAFTTREFDVGYGYSLNEEERKVVERIQNAREMLDDPTRAELVASFLYLTERYGSKEKAHNELMIRKPRFSEDQIRQVMHDWFCRTQSSQI